MKVEFLRLVCLSEHYDLRKNYLLLELSSTYSRPKKRTKQGLGVVSMRKSTCITVE